MACLVPGAEMTAAERECCKRMSHQCGSMDMPVSHSCCQREVQPTRSMMAAAFVHATPPAAIEVVADASTIPDFAENQRSLQRLQPPSESPPGSSSILRI